MGLRHGSRPIEGVQFHPDSILTPEGPRLFENFLRADELNAAEVFYPLYVWVCDECFLVQLQEYVKPDVISSRSLTAFTVSPPPPHYSSS